MNRAERRSKAAEQAAQQAQALASEAGRVLQQRAQEKTQEPEEKPQRPEGWRPTPRNDPRKAALEEMEQKERERAADLEKMRVTGEEPKEKPEPTVAAEPQDPPPPQADATPAEAPAAPKMVKVKIYGEEKEVPHEEVEEYGGIKGYQIAMAAKKDREELKQQLEQARQTQAMFAQYLAQQQTKQPEVNRDEELKALIDQERFGTPEESLAAKRKIAQLMNPAMPDEGSIILKATVNLKHDIAQRQFNTEFADVLATPQMKKFAQMMIQESLQQHVVNGQPNWNSLATVDWDNHFRTIGNQVRSMIGGKTQAASSTTVTSNTSASEKEAKKASIVNLPTASQRAALPAEEKPESREEILNRARKSRGLPTV